MSIFQRNKFDRIDSRMDTLLLSHTTEHKRAEIYAISIIFKMLYTIIYRTKAESLKC